MRRRPFAIGFFLFLLFGFGRLLLLILLLIFSLQIHFADLKPELYRVHFLRSPDGQWLSLLNFRVVLQTPDFVDVEEDWKEAKESMDYTDDEEENDWTTIKIDPIPIRPEKNWTSKLLVQLNEVEREIQKSDQNLEERIENEKEKGKPETEMETEIEGREGREEETERSRKPMRDEGRREPKSEQKDEENQEAEGIGWPRMELPEIELLKDILPWIPHVLRKHHKVHKAKLRTTTMPSARTTISLEDILKGSQTKGNATDQMMETGKQIEVGEGSQNIQNATQESAIETSAGTAENETAISITTTTEQPLEPINEEELALNLHKDSLHRNETTLRQILTQNLTRRTDGESQRENGGILMRDYGGSFILPLLKEIKYDNKSIPLVFSDESLKVSTSLEILHLGNFDNFQMEYELDALFHLQWFDVRLANNFTRPIRIREQQIIERIWKPDAMFFNSKFSYFHIVSFPNFRMRIEPDGHVTYTSRVTLLPDCQMNFCNFPHDTQRCNLLISSIAHPNTMLEFGWDPVSAIVFAKKISLPDLRIRNISTEQCQIGGKLIPSSCLALQFVLQRDSARYIAEKYLPSTLAMIFSWVAPYVPYNYEEVRIITPITVLLTLVQMEKGSQEVITSYLTSLDIWFVVIKGFTVLSLIESLTVMAYIKRGRAIEKQAQRASNEYQKDLLRAEAKRIVRVYHRLDHFSRVFFPVAFTCFLIFYLGFIAQRDENECQEQTMDFHNFETIM